jgi:hypothetical protein
MSEENVEVTSRPPFPASAEIEALVEELLKIQPLGQISYEEISRIIGEDCRTERGYNITYRARRRIQREEGYTFRCLSGHGYERCDDAGKLSVTKNGIRGIHRKTKRNEAILDTIELEKLEKANQQQYILNKTVLSILRQASNPRSHKSLANKLTHDSSANLNIAARNLLRLFGKGMNQNGPEGSGMEEIGMEGNKRD